MRDPDSGGPAREAGAGIAGSLHGRQGMAKMAILHEAPGWYSGFFMVSSGDGPVFVSRCCTPGGLIA